jgi:hypothetical protein
MAFDINKFKQKADPNKAAEGLQKAKEAAGQDVGSGSWASVLDVSKAPYTVKWWKPTAGTHILDIVGTLVTNPRNPAVRNGSIGLNDYDFGLTIWTHPDPKGGGPKGLPHVCLKRNGYAQSCPRCEEFFRKKEDGGTFVKGVKGTGNPIHRSSERTFLIIVPREERNVPGTVPYLWETSVHSFTSELLEEANALSEGGQPTFFWWPTEHGRTIQFDAVPGDLKDAFDFKRIKFHDRPESVGAALYEKWSFPLDEILIIPTAKQMEDEIYGRPDEEEEPQDTRSTSSSSTYHTEEADAPDTQETRTQHGKPEPDRETLPAEDGKWKAPDAEKPQDTGNKCPSGLEYGVSVTDSPQPRACRNCDKFDNCVDGK